MEIRENAEIDQLNTENYVKELTLTTVCEGVFRATGAMFEQDNMFTAAGSRGSGGGYK